MFGKLKLENKEDKKDTLSTISTSSMSLLSTVTTRELQQMPLELCDEDSQPGQKMNIVNTMVMFTDNTPVHVNNSQMENVEGYVCLGQHCNLKKQDNVIQVKVDGSRQPPGYLQKLHYCHLHYDTVYNSCLMPAMTYGAYT